MVWSRFFAPCMLPLAPGYLSYVTGLTGTNLTAAGNASTGATRTATRPSSRTPGAGGGRAGAVRGRVHRRVHPARLRRRAARPHAAGARPRHRDHRRSVDCRARARVRRCPAGPVAHWRISRLPKAGLAGCAAARRHLRPVVDAVPVTDTDGGARAGRRAGLRRPRHPPRRGVLAGDGAAVHRLRRRPAPPAASVEVCPPARGCGSPASAVSYSSPAAWPWPPGVWTEFVNWLRATVGPGQIGI
jgi:cytochrome c-type biogenesis protein